MKIAYIGIKGLPARSGADRVVEAIVHRLAEQHEISVYCSDRHFPQDADIKGIRLIRVPSVSGKYTHMTSVDFLAAWHAVLFGNYDLIHLHNIEASFVLPILRTRYKVITTAHGRITSKNKWGRFSAALMRAMEIPYARFSNAMTSVSLQDAQQLGARFRREIVHIPNGIDPEPVVDLESASRLLEEKGIIPHQFLLFAAGRIIPLKGAHDLLRAMQRLKKKYPLLVVGDLSQSPDYALKIKDLAGDSVTFLPFLASRAELLGLLQQSYAFVFPSTLEAMSIIFLEAASVGAPIICADIPANRAVLPDQALYFSPGNVDDLLLKLGWALDHPDEMCALGIRGRDWVREYLSWDGIVSQYDRLYQEVARGV